MEYGRGSTEAIDWIKHFHYKTNYPIIVQQLYDFRIYRMLVQSLNEEQNYDMQKNYIGKYGFRKGMISYMNSVRLKDSKDRYWKERYIEEELKKEPVKVEDIEKEIKEEERLGSLSAEELEKERLKDAVWVSKVDPSLRGIRYIPREILLAQPEIDRFKRNLSECIVFDKIYGCYSAVVFSPHRLKDGVQGSVLLRNANLEDLKYWAKAEMRQEDDREFNYRMKNPGVNKKKPEKNIDISHVERFMKPSGKDDLNGDIF